jgi:hypothetical protein
MPELIHRHLIFLNLQNNRGPCWNPTVQLRLTWLALVVCRPCVGGCACCSQGALESTGACPCAGALERCWVGAAAECALSRIIRSVGAGDCRAACAGSQCAFAFQHQASLRWYKSNQGPAAELSLQRQGEVRSRAKGVVACPGLPKQSQWATVQPGFAECAPALAAAKAAA